MAGSSELVETVRDQLARAGRLETFYGRLAVELAGRMEKPDETGISALSKELRLVMEAALHGVLPDGEVDEVERARRRREEMAARAREGTEQ